jgi:hypothetical protein
MGMRTGIRVQSFRVYFRVIIMIMIKCRAWKVFNTNGRVNQMDCLPVREEFGTEADGVMAPVAFEVEGELTTLTDD